MPQSQTPNNGITICQLLSYMQGVNGDRAVTFDQTRGITTFSWSEDGSSILYLQDNNGDENDHLYVVALNVTGRPKSVDLTPFPGVKAAGELCWTPNMFCLRLWVVDLLTVTADVR